MPCPDARVFSDFIEGKLDEAARDALENHLDQCEECRIALSEVGRAAHRHLGVGARDRHTSQLPVAGDVVGRYTIVSRLGAGAMGVVYLAQDPELHRELAIKVVQPKLGAPELELAQQRMLREGRLLARIEHENVVRVFDVGHWRGSVFVALARVQGVSLTQWLAAERRDGDAIVEVFRQCAMGLAAAHAAGVIHRDVKPDNVIIDAEGGARVTDFGLARTATEQASDVATQAWHDLANDPRITRTHGMIGTPAYMAPEQLLGGAAGERADQFSLCTALAEALGGARPFSGANRSAVVASMRNDRPKLARTIPRRIRKVLARGLSFTPEHRWPSMAALAEVLAPPRHVKRWWFAAAALVSLGAVSAIAVQGRQARDPCADVQSGIEATWNPRRAEQIAGGFARDQQAYTSGSWTYARHAIDTYVQRWSGMRVDVCRAGSARGELDAASRAATVRCLERQRLTLEALLERWERGGSAVRARAMQAVDSLRTPEHCTALGPEPVLTAAEARTRRTLDTRLAAAVAEAHVGRVTEAVASMRMLANEVENAPALQADVLLELASQERALGDPGGARGNLVAALVAAERSDAESSKARAWIALAEVAGDDGVRLQEARDALRLSSVVIERLGEPSALRGLHDVATSLVDLRSGDHRAAIAASRQSLARREELTVSERTRRRQILARALIAGGDNAGALSELELAEREITEAVGADAPALVYVLNSMIEPLGYLGRGREAIARGERALAIFDASLGSSNPRRAKLLGNIANVYANLEEHDKAIAFMQEELSMSSEAEDPHHVALVEQNLGATLIDAKRAVEALPHLERAHALLTQEVGARHPVIANVHSSLSRAHQALGNGGKSVEHARTALAIREELKVGVGFVAYSRLLLAHALAVAGEHAEGIAMARHALDPVDGVALSKTGQEGKLIGDVKEFLAAHAKPR